MDFKFRFQHLSKQDLRKRRFLFQLLGYRKTVRVLSTLSVWAIRFHFPIVKWLIKKYLFNVFVGGETLEESEPTVQKLKDYHIESILDYGSEGTTKEITFQRNHNQLLRTILFARDKHIPFVAIKITAIADTTLLEHVAQKKTLTPTEEAAYHKVVTRLHTMGKIAADNKIKILIDGEESWIQNAIDELCFRMMKIYNRTEVVFYNTIQLYRHDRLRFLIQETKKAKQKNVLYGVKLVRGAYVEKENKRAQKQGYLSPIHTSKQATDIDFDKGILHCIQHLDRMEMVVGTHNEYSIIYCKTLMRKHNIPANDKRIYFSQLLGMADPISFGLAAENYCVSKYLPYGPMRELLPYLSRRIEENSSLHKQVEDELTLIEQSLQQR